MEGSLLGTYVSERSASVKNTELVTVELPHNEEKGGGCYRKVPIAEGSKVEEGF